MKRKMVSCILALSLSVSAGAAALPMTVFAEDLPDNFAASVSADYQSIEMKYRPYARWWLAEGSHTDETLKESIQELYDAGYGGIEFVTLDESTYLDDATYGWGSPEWIHDSQLIIEECQKLGMSVSMTSGTHWSTANLTNITPDQDEASQELSYTVTDAFQESYSGELRLCDLPENVSKRTLVSVVAAKVEEANETETTLDFDSLETLSDDQIIVEEDGEGNLVSISVDYNAPTDGDYILFAFYQHGTGEYYTPASTGKSYTINYLDQDGSQALIDYWNENVLTEEMQSLIDDFEECDLYMDSLELQATAPETTGQLWSSELLAEFSNRCEYELSSYLPLMISNAGGLLMGNAPTYFYTVSSEDGQTFTEKLKNDFYQVETELYTENCLEVLADWLHEKNMKLRAENSYGRIFEISQPIKALDYVETESFEFGNEIDSYRLMSGAAHLLEKRFSSETGAAVNANYLFNTGYYNQIFYMQYAAGVQKTITHGYSSSYGPEENVEWPGYEGMNPLFSERFSSRQPASENYEELNEHFSIIQKVLEQGVPQMDIAMLKTNYNTDNLTYYYSNGNDFYNNRTHNQQGIYWQDMELQNAGYTYEYFSPYLLSEEEVSCSEGVLNADGVSYQALIVMEEELPLEAAEKLLEYAQNGLSIVFVNNVTEQNNQDAEKINVIAGSTTGSNDGQDDALAEIVDQIKALDAVKTVDSTEDAMEALQELQVYPRAAYTESNDKLLTVLRKTEDASYLYVYNYMYEDEEAYSGQISISGAYEPYELNTWSGDVEGYTDYTVAEDRTLLNVCVEPGEVQIFALDPNGNIEQTEAAAVTAEEYMTLDGWSLTVDSYQPGEKVTRTETNEETGVTTTEAAYETEHVMIDAGTLEELVPWKDMDAVGEYVSGVGIYTTTFTLADDWDSEVSRLVFKADSFNYGTASITINGTKAVVNMDTAEADLTEYLQAGENTIEVRVSSSLRNVMREVGYLIQGVNEGSGNSLQNSIGGWAEQPEADSYGMTGEARLLTYEK